MIIPLKLFFKDLSVSQSDNLRKIRIFINTQDYKTSKVPIQARANLFLDCGRDACVAVFDDDAIFCFIMRIE